MSEGSTFDVEEAGLATVPSIRQQQVAAASEASFGTAGRLQPGPGALGAGGARSAQGIRGEALGAQPGAVLGMPAPGTGMPPYQGWFPGMMPFPYQMPQMPMSMPPPMFPGYQDMCMASMMYQQQAMQQQQAMMMMMQQQAISMHMMGKPGVAGTPALAAAQVPQATQAQHQQMAECSAFQDQAQMPAHQQVIQQTMVCKQVATQLTHPSPLQPLTLLPLQQPASQSTWPGPAATTPISAPPPAVALAAVNTPQSTSMAPPILPPPTAAIIPAPNTPTSSATVTSQSLPDPPRTRRAVPVAAASVPNLQHCHSMTKRSGSRPHRAVSLPASLNQEVSDVETAHDGSATVKAEPESSSGQGVEAADAANWVALPMIGSPPSGNGVQGPGQVIYVSAKRAAAILRRREQRARQEASGYVGASPARLRKPYLHQSRHEHAQRRIRGPGGRFLSASEKAALLAEEMKADGGKSGDTWMEQNAMTGPSGTDNADTRGNNNSKPAGTSAALVRQGSEAAAPDGATAAGKAGDSKAAKAGSSRGKNHNRRTASFVLKPAGGNAAGKPRRPPARETSCVSAPATLLGVDGSNGKGNAIVASAPMTEGRLRSKRGASKSRPPSPPLPTLDEHAMESEEHPQAGARTRPGASGRNSNSGGGGSSRNRTKKAAKSTGGADGSGAALLSSQGDMGGRHSQSDEELLLIGGLKGSGSRTGGGDNREMSDPALAPLELAQLAVGGCVDGGLLQPPPRLQALGGAGIGGSDLGGLPPGVEDGDEELLLMMAGDLMQDIWEGGPGPLIGHEMSHLGGTPVDLHNKDAAVGCENDAQLLIAAGGALSHGVGARGDMEVKGTGEMDLGRGKALASGGSGAPGASSEDSGLVSADTLEARVKR